jgi:copper chaperone CopZ
VNELDGIVSIKTSYEKGNSLIEFDKTRTNQEEIKEAVESTGYKATKLTEQ